MNIRPSLLLCATVMLIAPGLSFAQTQKAAPAAGKETVLKADEVSPKLFPDKVFFRGQVANVQARNTGGVRYADEFLVMAGLVDNSGYSTGIREKYQAYLISEVSIEIGWQKLKPGAYGIGFLDNNKFIVMDLGANDLFTTSSTKDAEIKRPVPLQFVAASEAGKYRLYHGRDYVEFHRAN